MKVLEGFSEISSKSHTYLPNLLTRCKRDLYKLLLLLCHYRVFREGCPLDYLTIICIAPGHIALRPTLTSHKIWLYEDVVESLIRLLNH